jgi:circadian clock protein KaiC
LLVSKILEVNSERVSTGVGGLDDILGGGLPKSRLYLVQGQPGVGKTTLALQFLLEGVKAGEKVLYITLSETEEEVNEVATSHGWSLRGIDLFDLSAMEEALDPEYDNTVFHPSEVELGETTKTLLSIVDRVQPTRAVFDSLSEMRLLARDPLRYRRQILSLKHYFAGKNCTVLLLDDLTSDPRDLQLQSIAHGVILIEQIPIIYGVDRRRVRIQKLRGSSFRSGYHDAGIETGGLRIYPRLVAAEHRHGIAEGVISSGIPSLDELMGGGLDRGVSTLLLGPAGSGKSTISIQYAMSAAQRGESALIYSFEESPRTLYKRSLAMGMDLKKYVDEGFIRIQHIDPAELTPGQFVHTVRKDVTRGNVSIVVIDSLNGYLNAMPEEKFLVLQLHELLSFLGQMGITTLIVVAQHGMLGAAMATPVDVSYLADTVLLFRFYEFEGNIRRAISVVKRRGGEHDSAIRELRFMGKEGIFVGDALHNLRGVLTGVPVRELTVQTAG